MADDVDARLNRAAALFAEGDEDRVVSELLEAVKLLSAEGAGLLSSVSASEFDSPFFAVVRRIFAVFENLPENEELAALVPDASSLLPASSASPAEMLAAVSTLYEQAEEEGEAPTENRSSIIETLIALLSGQQTFRDMLFAEDGMYVSAASAAAPYLAGLFTFSGEEFESAAEKADSMLFGPLRRLAELFYSLLTSSLTAGLLLLVIRRAIPVMRPSKMSTAVDAVMLTVSNIPELISGLRCVAKELSCLRKILQGEGDTETSL